MLNSDEADSRQLGKDQQEKVFKANKYLQTDGEWSIDSILLKKVLTVSQEDSWWLASSWSIRKKKSDQIDKNEDATFDM
jgi:hypothetical protein